MRKLLLSLVLVLLLTGQGIAANYYFDLASGNDTTGDGSTGTPWKTIDKCTTSRSAGDECRAAKTAITTLAGTLTFTNDSTSVATSTDLTAVVAPGDIVGKNSGYEGWWTVASLNSSAITLNYKYWGISGSGSAVTGYKITPVAASEELDVNSSGSSGSLITISGGWDLTGPTQNGITAFSSGYANGIDTNGKHFLKISKFVVVGTTTNGIYLSNSTDSEISDCWAINPAGYGFNIRSGSYRQTVKNNVTCGGTGDGFYISVFGLYNDLYSFSTGTGSGDYGFEIAGAMIGKNLFAYNSYSGNFYFSMLSHNSFFNGISGVGVVNGSNISTVSFLNDIRFYNSTFSGASQYVFTSGTSNANNVYFINCSITDGGSGRYALGSSSFGFTASLSPKVIEATSGADAVQYFSYGSVTHDSTAAARSGKAIKISNTAVSYPTAYKVGAVKIPSAATDLTLNAYLKDDAGFDGNVYFMAVRNGGVISVTEKTPTTSYVKESIVVSAADLVANEYLDLYVWSTGSAGSIWIDDFSAEQ